ncbi:putative membrane protein [Ehrlichia japonica]|uniref:Putative membrane protein n=1 Tax=Ehrlichia japonica TaxID=391036 RepID=X5H305_9RICK|nr:putative membrane protein [Ehrlichia japonica]AHX04553.1 putative membrane protein [Ehrlichia japonica]AHX04975.1 putative membrane protein [Ehrlichia japonica]AHX05053.1 putative membrane protein [Ehrlichia japonica]
MDFALVSFVPPPPIIATFFCHYFLFLSAAIMKIILDHF